MRDDKKFWMVVITIIVIILIMGQQQKLGKKEAGPGGWVITRTITPSSVSAGGEFTIKYTFTGGSGNFGGILYETVPAGFTIQPLSFLNSLDVFSKKITGQLIEMPLAGTISGQYIEFKVTAGSSTGALNLGKIEWGGGATENLPSASLTISAACSPSCSCAASTCTGQTCSNGCGGTCSGTMVCACTDTTWNPSPSTVCSGTSFTQTSNCGNTRSSVGTMSCSTSHPVLTRTVTPASVSAGGEFTIKYTFTSVTSSFGGIIYETIPSGFTINSVSFLNNMDVFSKKITGQLIEMPLTGTTNGQYIEYKVNAGSSTGNLNLGKIEWGTTPMVTDNLPSSSLTVGAAIGCTQDSQCTSLDGACVLGDCNTATGQCVPANKVDGTACTGGVCVAGVCGSPQTCEVQGGIPCSSGQICSGGNFVSSSNYGNLCCVGGTCAASQQTCSQLGGDICTTGQECSGGTMVDSSDTANLCCTGASGSCQDIVQTCEEKLECMPYIQTCNTAQNACQLAKWVVPAGVGFGALYAFSMLAR